MSCYGNAMIVDLKRAFGRRSGGRRTLQASGGPLTLIGREGDRYFERASPRRRSEAILQSLLDRGVRGEGAALDIGANIGLTTVMIARAGAGPVFAFEPHPPTFRYLTQTIAANGLDSVRAIDKALGREPGELPFFVDEDSSASHVVAPQNRGRRGSITVPVATVDDFCATIDTPVRFIKIDAEGAEPDILAGARETLERDRPGVFVEFNLFTLMALSDVNPRRMLAGLCADFTHVYRFSAGDPYPIGDDTDIVNFLHEMLTTNEINTDLWCAFEPL